MSAGRRARSWVAALREGATTPWAEWSGAADPADPADPAASDHWLPGAQQLELLRRLNLEAARMRRPVPAALADRVLAASAPGRGRQDLRLVGPGQPRPFGPPPVDPSDLADAELTRVAAGLLAEDLASLDAAGEGTGPQRVGRRRPWAPSYHLAGHPWLVGAVRAELARAGRPERDRPREVYVLGADLPTMVADAWVSRCFGEGAPAWTDWLGGYVEGDRLPPRADVLAAARAWARRVGAPHVTVVLDLSLLARPLRMRRVVGPPPLDAAAVELARRVGATLGILVGHERRPALLRRVLAPRLARSKDPGGGAPVRLPEYAASWARERSESLRSGLRSGGYSVLGDPDRVSPHAPSPDGGNAPEAEVLSIAVRLLLDPVSATDTEEAVG